MENLCHNETTWGVQLFADNDWNSEFMIKIRCNKYPVYSFGPDGNIVNSNAQRPFRSCTTGKLDSLF
jgi:hypothetical protein